MKCIGLSTFNHDDPSGDAFRDNGAAAATV